MRTLILSVLLSLSVAVPVLAGDEKSGNDLDIKPGTNSFQALIGLLDASSPTYDRIFATGVAADCGLATADSGNDGMALDIFCIEVSDGEPIEIIVDPAQTNIADTVLTLYCDPFDPLLPGQNVIAYDDDDGIGTLSALTSGDGIRLVPGREYWVVVSTYGAGMYGQFRVSLSDNAFPCGGVAVDGATWGDLKGMYR